MVKNIKNNRSRNILIFLVILSGLVLASYLASSQLGSFDIRNRAATETETILKGWEFDGNTSEGWNRNNNLFTLTAQNGFLESNFTRFINPAAPASLKKAFIKNDNVLIQLLPRYINKFKIRLGVTPWKSSIVGININPTAKQIISPQPSPFTFDVYYMISGKNTWEPSLKLQGTADGNLYEYELTFPINILNMNAANDPTGNQPIVLSGSQISKLKIDYGSPLFGQVIRIDWIRLVVTQPSGGGEAGKRPISTETITKEGDLFRDNLEGVSPFVLEVSSNESYRISARPDEGSFFDRFRRKGGGQGWTFNDLGKYVNRRVSITGTLTSKGTGNGYGFGTQSPLLTISSISDLGPALNQPPAQPPTDSIPPWLNQNNQESR